LYSFKSLEHGAKYRINLSSFKQFLRKINSPHLKLSSPILITGTKGKGSTAHILANILRRKGNVGLYTSPHLTDICERIEVNNTPISKREFVSFLEELKPYLTKERSVFEILTTIAFKYFVNKRVNFSILEIGMGGRLDATNVVKAEVSILTPISLDHTEILGKTIEEIAKEKCEIIHPNSYVITAPQDFKVLEIIKKKTREMNATLCVVGEDLFCEKIIPKEWGTTFTLEGEEYFLPLRGRHQIINALTAIAGAKFYNVNEKDIRKGLICYKPKGRLHLVAKAPLILLDSAHNVASAWALRRSIVELFTYEKLILIFGILKDKDKEGVITTLFPLIDYAFIPILPEERASKPCEIKEIFERLGVKAKISRSPLSALKEAKKIASPKDLILITGSIYLVGKILNKI
jgi:dihydrofolate synthase/folylpolyglutamate synthase